MKNLLVVVDTKDAAGGAARPPASFPLSSRQAVGATDDDYLPPGLRRDARRDHAEAAFERARRAEAWPKSRRGANRAVTAGLLLFAVVALWLWWSL